MWLLDRICAGDLRGLPAYHSGVLTPLCVHPTGYCIAFVYNWRTALLITGTAPLVALGGMLHVKLVFGNNTESDKIYSTANSAVTEAISSIRVIQASRDGLRGCPRVRAADHDRSAVEFGRVLSIKHITARATYHLCLKR